jgi:hypothetical protein
VQEALNQLGEAVHKETDERDAQQEEGRCGVLISLLGLQVVVVVRLSQEVEDSK